MFYFVSVMHREFFDWKREKEQLVQSFVHKLKAKVAEYPREHSFHLAFNSQEDKYMLIITVATALCRSFPDYHFEYKAPLGGPLEPSKNLTIVVANGVYFYRINSRLVRDMADFEHSIVKLDTRSRTLVFAEKIISED